MLKAKLIKIFPRGIANLLYKMYHRNKYLGMTSKEEQKMYAEYTSRLMAKEGAIVDLGCWMGSTSNSLAKGIKPLNASTSKSNTIYAYDQFIWYEWMDMFLPLVSKPYKEGDVFIEEAIKRTSLYGDLIQVIKADLTEYQWDGKSIKILLVDAMKNRELTVQIARSFFPSLAVGSIVLHQDFKHFYTPWIHILQYNLRNHFEAIEDVKTGGTAVFELTKSISQEQITQASDFENIDDKTIENVFEYSKNIIKHDNGNSLDSAKIMYYVHTDQKQKAASLYNLIAQSGNISGELKSVAPLIK